jgi:hypothetical protein
VACQALRSELSTEKTRFYAREPVAFIYLRVSGALMLSPKCNSNPHYLPFNFY